MRHVSSDGRYLTGTYEDASSIRGFAYDRTTSTLYNLSLAGDSLNIAQGASTGGLVTGSFVRRIPGLPPTRGAYVFDLSSQTRTEFLDVGGRSAPRFRDINDSGLIAGGAGQDGFVGRPGDWFFFSGDAQRQITAYGVNDAGVAVGFAMDAVTGAITGGIAFPVPEPASWALFAVGLGCLGWRLRRRA